MAKPIDLNADLGEGCAFDAELMAVVTSSNIACGGHAGDGASMRVALQLAKEHEVSAGAHPSFPDRENFGRTKSALAGAALEQELAEQVLHLKRSADEIGVALTHLKPHGALYNMAAQDASLATSIVHVLQSVLPGAALFGPPSSQLEAAARARDIRFIAEGFADRAYEPDGRLRDRTKPGAVFEDAEIQARQAMQIALEGRVSTYDGTFLALPAATICVHGDTPGAFAAAQAIRATLEQNGADICAPT
ncbi:MAG: 5-oxoprolinase subunit PxpA [Pseudomonadota bacterium]